MQNIIIAAEDLGGTKSFRRVFSWDGRSLSQLSEAEILVSPSTSYVDLSERAENALGTKFGQAHVLSHAVAGLIAGKGANLHVKLTAFPRGKMELGKALGVKQLNWQATVQGAVNDFVAQAWAMNLSEVTSEYQVIVAGRSNPAHDGVIFGPGTGCGVAKLVRDAKDRNHFIPSASEGGNLPFPVDSPTWENKIGFLPWLEGVVTRRKRFRRESGHRLPVRIEHVISGIGIELTYEFITGQRPGIKVIDQAIKAKDKKALKAADLWAGYCGRVARTYAIAFTGWGGVWISGGAVQKLPQVINRNSFRDAFLAAPTDAHAFFLERTPVRLLLRRDIGVMGAAAYGIELASQLNA